MDTTLQGVAPWLNEPQDKTAGTSFLRAFEAAQEQKAPLYLAKVQEAQAQIQNMGFELQRNQIALDMAKTQQQDMIQGQKSESDIAKIFADKREWTDSSKLADAWALYSKMPTAKGKAMMETGSRLHKEAVDAKSKSGLAAFRQDPVGSQYSLYQQALESGDNELAEFHKARLVKLTQGTGWTIKTNPDGTVELVQGGTGTGLERAVNTELEKKMAANERSLSLIEEAIPGMTPTTVGPFGKVRKGLETAANIVKPGSMAMTATEAQQKMRIAAQNMYSSLKADSQINKMEAAAMKEIADVTSWHESAPGAIRKYEILRSLTGLQNVLMAHELKKPAPDNALRAMTDIEMVARQWKSKNLTDEEVIRWNTFHPVTK